MSAHHHHHHHHHHSSHHHHVAAAAAARSPAAFPPGVPATALSLLPRPASPGAPPHALHHHHLHQPNYVAAVPNPQYLNAPAGAAAGPSADPGAQPPMPLQVYGRLPALTTYASRVREGRTGLMLPPSFSRRADKDDGFANESGEEEYGRGVSRREAAARRERERERELQRQREQSQQRQPLPEMPSKRVHGRTKHIYRSEKEMEALAGVQEDLCPIRLDIDTEDMKLRDTFMWNVNEQHLTPEQFAEILCDDLDLPPDQFVAPIAESIKGQVDEYEALQNIFLGEDEDLEYRTTIELDLHLGSVHYCDRFEWDPASSWPTPEGFARQLCADLGVGGEFVNCIAHALHEQLYRHRKEKITRLEETDEQEEDHPPLKTAFRPPADAERWSPLMELLSPDALEKALLEKERGSRRIRREFGRTITSNVLAISRRRSQPATVQTVSTKKASAPPPSVKRKPGRPPRTPGDGKLSLEEMPFWKCVQCGIDAYSTPICRQGPDGSRTLCNTCGLYWQSYHMQGRGKLPAHRKDQYRQ